jgi:hypothetical protein
MPNFLSKFGRKYFGPSFKMLQVFPRKLRPKLHIRQTHYHVCGKLVMYVCMYLHRLPSYPIPTIVVLDRDSSLVVQNNLEKSFTFPGDPSQCRNTIFVDFIEKKSALFLNTKCYDQFFARTSSVLNKKRPLFAIICETIF